MTRVVITKEHKCPVAEEIRVWAEVYEADPQGFVDLGTKLCVKCRCEAEMLAWTVRP